MRFSDEEVELALMRIGASMDGRYLRQLLLDALISVPVRNCDVGALKEEAGRRTFASDLIKALYFVPEQTTNDRRDASELVQRSTRGAVKLGTRQLSRVEHYDDLADARSRRQRRSAESRTNTDG